jgi:site-specific DNA-methyltransferase (adenine-specific)
MVLTDPPYGMNYQSNHRKEKLRKIENDVSLEWLSDFTDHCYRILKPDSSAYIFCSWHKVDIFKQEFERRFKLKNILVWVKNNHGSGDLTGAYAPKHEFVLYMHKGRTVFRNGRTPDVVYSDKVAATRMVHPTEKPVKLLEKFILDNSDEGDIVIDPFMGSGTTGVAAKNLKRSFIGIELDEEYFKIAQERIEKTNPLDEFFG